ncbi:MAG: UDP-glucose/GDP-mannose dehydrogenase family protein [Candidatus Omnitrophica bacterium]|nr:UDP-glucose/GDP-mannose dehydrogenase family protein [Candidatus Omnitrophota bacterium]
MKIGIIGSGYVGLVTGVCFAHLGHRVICVDNDVKKIAMLKKNHVPIYEPGLEEMIRENVAAKRLSFTTRISQAVSQSEVLFICVNTPPKENGEADLSFVETVSKEIALHLKEYRLIVEKSTVPVQTGEWVEKTIRNYQPRRALFDVASNPEFLREGSAIQDFLKPDRVIIGVSNSKSEKILRKLYGPLKAPILVTDIKSAEIIKHAANSFLATKISFINMVARICDAVGADVEKVAQGMGLDPRIGPSFLKAGIGFGGFCFPKDLSAFLKRAEKLGVGFELLSSVLAINEQQKQYFVQKIENHLWNLNHKTLAILGLSFKPDTDDMRFAPSIDIIKALEREGVHIRAYDPQAMKKAKSIFPKIEFTANPYAAMKNADALVIVTEWDEFSNLDWKKVKRLLKHPIVFDGRNQLNQAEMKKLGFQYHGIGRPR